MNFDVVKARPIWQELPETFKIDVVKLLDYETRSNLRLSSSSDRDLVNKSPLNFKTIILECKKNFQISIELKPRLASKSIFLEKDFFGFTAPLLKIFSNPKITVRRLILEFLQIPELLLGIQRNNIKKIKLNSIFFKRTCRSDDKYGVRDSFLEFVEHLDVKTMIIDGKCPPKYFDRLVETEQWKKAQGISFPTLNHFEIDKFLHLNSLRLTLQKLNSEGAKKLIQSFIHRETFAHTTTFFQISTEEAMNPVDIIDDAEDDRWILYAQERGFAHTSNRVQHFKMVHSDHLIFVVKATAKMLAGSVCRPPPDDLHDYLESPLI